MSTIYYSVIGRDRLGEFISLYTESHGRINEKNISSAISQGSSSIVRWLIVNQNLPYHRYYPVYAVYGGVKMLRLLDQFYGNYNWGPDVLEEAAVQNRKDVLLWILQNRDEIPSIKAMNILARNRDLKMFELFYNKYGVSDILLDTMKYNIELNHFDTIKWLINNGLYEINQQLINEAIEYKRYDILMYFSKKIHTDFLEEIHTEIKLNPYIGGSEYIKAKQSYEQMSFNLKTRYGKKSKSRRSRSKSRSRSRSRS
jgi:hypothetical protein